MQYANIKMCDSTWFWAGYLTYITGKLGHLIESTAPILMPVLHRENDRPKLTLDKKI